MGPISLCPFYHSWMERTTLPEEWGSLPAEQNMSNHNPLLHVLCQRRKMLFSNREEIPFPGCRKVHQCLPHSRWQNWCFSMPISSAKSELVGPQQKKSLSSGTSPSHWLQLNCSSPFPLVPLHSKPFYQASKGQVLNPLISSRWWSFYWYFWDSWQNVHLLQQRTLTEDLHTTLHKESVVCKLNNQICARFSSIVSYTRRRYWSSCIKVSALQLFQKF